MERHADSHAMSSEFYLLQHLIHVLAALNFKTTVPISRVAEMNNKTVAPDEEFEAIRTVYTALEALDHGARTRVMNYINFPLPPSRPRASEIGSYGTSTKMRAIMRPL